MSGCQENVSTLKKKKAVPKKASSAEKGAPAKKSESQESDDSDPDAAWKVVATFNGVGMENTPEFTISSDDWRATAVGSPNNPPNADLAAFLRLRGDDPESMTDRGIVYATGSETGIKNFAGPGSYFFHMHAKDGVAWAIKVEERVLKLY